jgi:hypothetical protein
LLLVLRNLALDWVRGNHLRWVDAVEGVAGTVMLGALVSPCEEQAVNLARMAAPGLLRVPWA